MLKPPSVDQRSWDALKSAILADRIDAAVERQLADSNRFSQLDEATQKRLIAAHRELVMRQLGGESSLKSEAFLQPALRKFEEAAAILEAHGLHMEAVIRARDELADEVEQQTLDELVDLAVGRTLTSRTVANTADLDDERIDSLEHEMGRIWREVEELQRTSQRAYERARAEMQAEVRSLLAALTLRIDPSELRMSRYIPVRLYTDDTSDARDAELVRALIKISAAAGFDQAEP